MCMEDKAVKELNELKAQVNALRDGVTYFNRSGGNLDNLLTAYIDTPAQCLKQHDLDLLNQLKDKFINSNQSCELILADMINSLELEK